MGIVVAKSPDRKDKLRDAAPVNCLKRHYWLVEFVQIEGGAIVGELWEDASKARD